MSRKIILTWLVLADNCVVAVVEFEEISSQKEALHIVVPALGCLGCSHPPLVLGGDGVVGCVGGGDRNAPQGRRWTGPGGGRMNGRGIRELREESGCDDEQDEI